MPIGCRTKASAKQLTRATGDRPYKGKRQGSRPSCWTSWGFPFETIDNRLVLFPCLVLISGVKQKNGGSVEGYKLASYASLCCSLTSD